MSYSATICFKTLKEGEVYAFLKKIKDICKEKFDEIAEENFIKVYTFTNTASLTESESEPAV